MTDHDQEDPADALAYSLCDVSMDIADRGGIPDELWEMTSTIAADVIGYPSCRSAAASLLASTEEGRADMLSALLSTGHLTAAWSVTVEGGSGERYEDTETRCRQVAASSPRVRVWRRAFTEWTEAQP